MTIFQLGSWRILHYLVCEMESNSLINLFKKCSLSLNIISGSPNDPGECDDN